MSGFTSNSNSGNEGQMWDLIRLMSDGEKFKSRLAEFGTAEINAQAVIQKSGEAYQQSVQAKVEVDAAAQQVVLANEQLKNDRAAFEEYCARREAEFTKRAERHETCKSAIDEFQESIKQTTGKYVDYLLKREGDLKAHEELLNKYASQLTSHHNVINDNHAQANERRAALTNELH